MNTLSVIIPNYNKEKYLGKCISSILMQSFLPSEIIIVDDCSTDNSRKLILDFAEKSTLIKPIFLDKNEGVSRARNIGLESAISKIVTFIDSDDFYYNPNKLKNEMQQLIEIERKGYRGLAYSTTIIVDDNGKLISCRQNRNCKRREFVHGDNTLMTLVSLSKQKRVPRDYCIRKETLIEVGAYSYPKNFYEDLDLLMRLSKSGVFFQPTYQAGTAYRQVSTGLSKQNTKLHEKEINAICNNYSEYLKPAEKIYSNFSRGKIRVQNSIFKIINKARTRL